jgi:hypothetical protein
VKWSASIINVFVDGFIFLMSDSSTSRSFFSVKCYECDAMASFAISY